jgi:ProQ/FINO family
MPSDITRRLTIADIGRKPLIDLTEPPRPAPRPLKPPATAKPPPKVAKPPAPVQAAPAKAKPRDPQVDELLLQLQARYPVTFAKGWPKPLVIGVHHQIIADTVCDPEVLRMVLRLWCRQAAYLANMIDMTHRHALDGTPVAELTEAEHANARQQWAALKAMFKARAKQRRAGPS